MATETVYKKQLQSLDELKDLGLCIIEDAEVMVENRLAEILKEKGLIISDLAKLTGISRQNINAVIQNKMTPSIEFVLKVSYVLGIKEVDGIFTLPKEAWVKPYRQERDATVYINLVTLTLIDAKEKRKEIKKTGYEYFNTETKQLLTKNQYENLYKRYFDQHLEDRIQSLREEALKELKSSGQFEEMYEEIREQHENASEEEITDKIINAVLTVNQAKSKASVELRNEFNRLYSKIYKKVGEPFEPYVIK